ncbi:LysR family transcriptional regulator [Pelagibius sp. Alg239-R121]|uniref:LysR family transcriptional regulator n=1 Tax=Pelagibius sp. Alg239-R121 TaxID=2993448 RepID=UPI0024A6A20F|nr:LysR family transcriptional regulator [Pelagibius sp. Alg239-R121]
MTLQLESDLLRSFVAVAESENFTRAANALGRTQSAVSMQMKRLEELVGDPLFERGPRGVVLTRRGRSLLINARRIVDLLDETAASLTAPPLDGQVRIGIPEEYGASVLSRALGAFGKVHSNVEIMVRYGCSSVHKEALERGELDLAVIFEWAKAPRGEVLMVDPTVWATSEVHRMHERSPLPVALYQNDGWCMDFAIRSLERRGHSYRAAYRSDTSAGLKLAVSSGLAIAPLSRSNIPAGCRELTAADGFGDIDASNVVMYLRKNMAGDAVTAMADAIREGFRARSFLTVPGKSDRALTQ